MPLIEIGIQPSNSDAYEMEVDSTMTMGQVKNLIATNWNVDVNSISYFNYVGDYHSKGIDLTKLVSDYSWVNNGIDMDIPETKKLSKTEITNILKTGKTDIEVLRKAYEHERATGDSRKALSEVQDKLRKAIELYERANKLNRT